MQLIFGFRYRFHCFKSKELIFKCFVVKLLHGNLASFMFFFCLVSAPENPNASSSVSFRRISNVELSYQKFLKISPRFSVDFSRKIICTILLQIFCTILIISTIFCEFSLIHKAEIYGFLYAIDQKQKQ